jgi:hypothetical protein
MNYQRRHWAAKVKEERHHEINREMAKNETAFYDGETAEYGYNQVIFDLLKDPVSLGMVGSNGNRGHQR